MLFTAKDFFNQLLSKLYYSIKI